MEVEAVIVTHDDPTAVDRCVRSILQQSAGVSCIRIVDTAGRQPVMASTGQRDPRIIIERTAVNVGPAGGWAIGLARFAAGRAAVAWLMDDDCRPRADALATSLEDLEHADVVQSTMVESSTERVVSTQGWCGILVKREVVEAVGVPDEDLVWWTEDTEYIQWRIPRAGFRVRRSERAIVQVSLRPERAPKPAWKYYYEARNQVAFRIRTQRPGPDESMIPRHRTVRVRWWRAFRSVTKLSGRSIVVENSGRLAKFAMVWRGTFDGLRGRTGLRVPLGVSDRARTSTADGRV